MNVELFILDEKTRLVDLNKPWISTIKEFKKLITRDKGSKGDVDGRKKLQATREFTYIYHLVDYKSQFGNYAEKDRIIESAKNAELPEDFDHTKDEDLALAIKKYHDLQDTPALKLLIEAKEGLHTAHKVIRKIRVNLETKLMAADLDEIGEIEGKNGKKILVDPLTQLTISLEALLKLTNSVGPALVSIKGYEEQVKKELGDKESLRGNKEKGIKEDYIPTRTTDTIEEEATGTTASPDIFNDI